MKINPRSLNKLIICSYCFPKGIVYEQLLEKLENKSTNLLTMVEFNNKHINHLGLEETNHYGTKLMERLNSSNLFLVQNNNHT